MLAATVLVGTALIASPAAASPSGADSAPGGVPGTTWAALDDAIGMDGVFDGAQARAGGAAAWMVDDFATGWAATGNPVRAASVDRVLVEAVESASARACVGRNRLDYTGLQLNAYLNSCNSAKLLGMVSSAAGVGVIAAAVTSWTGVGGLAAGTIAGTFAVSAGLIQTCSANGRGMAAHMIPPTAVMWCNNQ